MEPPPFGDGNSGGRRPCSSSCRPFNGATALRRWKLGWTRSHRPSCRPFNGATALRRWKLEVHPDLAVLVQPSMEPPPFGDGNATGVAADEYAARSFNGATALRRWKPRKAAETVSEYSHLQWSHRPSAMETSVNAAALGVFEPSMEPPPFGDGNVNANLERRMAVRSSMEPPPFGDGN